jgi:hypothetical protein
LRPPAWRLSIFVAASVPHANKLFRIPSA